MSSYKAKTYATALVSALAEKNPDGKNLAVNFIALLQKNGDVKKSRHIIDLAEKLLLKKTGNKKVTLETARNIDIGKSMKGFIKKGDIVQEKINPVLIAGVKIVVDGEKQLDLSLLHKLNNIF